MIWVAFIMGYVTAILYLMLPAWLLLILVIAEIYLLSKWEKGA